VFFQAAITMKKSALFCLFCLSCVFCSGVTESPPLVAVISTKEATSSLADGITAQLSSKNVRLVERQEIDKILTEHKLNVSGMINPNNAIRLGKLLKADIIAPVTTENDAVEKVVVFDVKTGIRLEDMILGGKELDGKMLEATAIIIAAVEKQQLLKTKNIVLLSFLPMNQVFLQEKTADSAKKVQSLLQRKLLQQRNFLLLERDYAELLISEKIITSQDISSLESCLYTIELEVRPAGQRENMLSLALFLKNNNRECLNKLAVDYIVGDENMAVTGILNNFIAIKFPETGESSSANRIAEARVFLLDGQKACGNMDYDKSLLSIKNAYLLNPGLKSEINQILAQIFNAQDKAVQFTTKDSEKVKLYGQIIEVLIFYKQINGTRLCDTYANMEILPEDLQNRYRVYFHECFMEMLDKIKRDYNYTSLQPNTLEYLKCFEQYLSALEEKCPSDGFMFYMASDLTTFFKAVSEYCRKNPQDCKEFGSQTMRLSFCADRFCAAGYVFDKNLFNKTIELYGLMLKSPIIPWQLQAIENIYWLRNSLEVYIAARSRSPKPQSPEEVYESEIISRVKASLLLSEFDDANYRYEFFVDLLQKAAGAPENIKRACKNYFYQHYYERSPRDPQQDRTILIMGLKAGLDMKIALDNMNMSMPSSQGRNVQDDIKEFMELKRQVAFLNNKNFESEVDKKIAYRREMLKVFELETCLESYQTILKYPPDRLGSDGYSTSMFLSSPVLRDDKYFYLTLNSTCDEYFSLIKVDYKDNFKLIRGQEGHLNSDYIDPYSKNYNTLCISKDYIVKISARGGIFLYPKDGSMPAFYARREIKNKKIESALSVGDKVYFMQSPDFTAHNTIEFQVMEFDLKTKTLRLVFASNQLDNNPLGTLGRMPDMDYFIIDEAGKSLVFSLNYAHWRFLPFSTTWEQLDENGYSEIKRKADQSKTIHDGQKDTNDNLIGWSWQRIIFIEHNKIIDFNRNVYIKSIILMNGKRYCLYQSDDYKGSNIYESRLSVGVLKDINELLPLASVFGAK
jgi:hypothetical protein